MIAAATSRIAMRRASPMRLAMAGGAISAVRTRADAVRSDVFHRSAASDELKAFFNKVGLEPKQVFHNAPPATLYEQAVNTDPGSAILNSGALCVRSGEKTGRSPKDKRVVDEPSSADQVWWGPVNFPMTENAFLVSRDRTMSYLNTVDTLYVVDGYAGWDLAHRKKVRVVCERPYHALFMQIMMVRPTKAELATFGEPDLVIYNGGKFSANPFTEGITSKTSVDLNFASGEMLILGTEYAGEMKKGIFTYMMHEAMKHNCLPLHASMNAATSDGTSTLFFGLSGTGKTTLSADPKRRLIGDDEHVWTPTGCYNIEGGCYAKCVDLTPESEPEIYNAIKFGAVLENVTYTDDRSPDYANTSITQNTRCAYPLEHIEGAQIPAVGQAPNNVIFLTCDAFGVLPPVSKLTPEQASYHFISGYTAKIAGTEQGIVEPVATFSACYGGPFLVRHPMEYAKRLSQKLNEHGSTAWLINTGWTGGGYGEGNRMSLKHTRAIIDAIHDGSLKDAKTFKCPQFGLEFAVECGDIPFEVLNPREGWADKSKYDAELSKLASLFRTNFEAYKSNAEMDVLTAGPSSMTDAL